MDISPINAEIYKVILRERYVRSVSKPAVVRSDRTDFSDRGKEASLVRSAMDGDEARRARIDEIRARIQEGTYFTDEMIESLAEKLAKLFI